MQLKYDLLPQADQEAIRQRMLKIMLKQVAKAAPHYTRTQRLWYATKLVNEALEKEKERNGKVNHVSA